MSFARRHVLLVFAATLVSVMCITASTAGAAPTRSASAANLCSVAKGVGHSLVKTPSTTSFTTELATTKKNAAKILAAKGALVSAAPGSIKKNIKTVIAWFGLVQTDLNKVHWNIAALESKPALVQRLIAAGNKAEPSFNRLKVYFHKTCHLD